MPRLCLALRVEDRHFLEAQLVDEPSQFGVDLARGEVLGVELRAVAVDLGDVRDRLVELDQAAGVEEDLGLYRVHTITAPSYGS